MRKLINCCVFIKEWRRKGRREAVSLQRHATEACVFLPLFAALGMEGSTC